MEPTDFMAEEPEDSRHTLSLVRIPAHSAASTMGESQEVSLLVDNRALAEVSTEEEASTAAEVSMEAVATANSVNYQKRD